MSMHSITAAIDELKDVQKEILNELKLFNKSYRWGNNIPNLHAAFALPREWAKAIEDLKSVENE